MSATCAACVVMCGARGGAVSGARGGAMSAAVKRQYPRPMLDHGTASN